MTGTNFETGATLVIRDDFTRTLDKLFAGIDKAENSLVSFQTKLDKLNMGASVKTINEELENLVKSSSAAGDKIALSFAGSNDKIADGFAGMATTAGKAFTDIVEGSRIETGNVLTNFTGLEEKVGGSFGGMTKAATAEMAKITEASGIESKAILGNFNDLGHDAAAAFQAVKFAADTQFSEIVTLSEVTAGKVQGNLSRMSEGVAASAGISTSAAAAATTGGASLRTRRDAGHRVNNSHAGGPHFGSMGTHVGGTHVGMGGDGIAPAVGGFVLLELLKEGVGHAFDFQHWVSGFEGAGLAPNLIEKAKSAAWANAAANPNASAAEGMKNILELNKATGNLDESIELLPLFSKAEMAMQSVKAEGLHSKFNGGNQVLNLAKGMEEMGFTSRGATPEERSADITRANQELIRTMVASRGLFDGNKLFALTNNSGGAAQNWDLRFGTTIAPIIGDIMGHSKLGNALYMANKSFQGGQVTSDAVAGLVKYGLATVGPNGDAEQDSKGKWHLHRNSAFAKGLAENPWEWSGRQLEKLKENGIDIGNQEKINEIVNEIGSNKSNSMLMRALLEPATRRQIEKEITLRDQTPNNVASVLQNDDPVLKIDALHKKVEDFFTALGGPLVDPAIAALTKITAGINSFAQTMHDHPDATKYGAEAAGVAGVGLLGYGGGKMLGLFGSSSAHIDSAATKLEAAAAHMMGGHGGTGSPGGGTPGSGKGGTSLDGGRVAMFGLGWGGLVFNAPSMDAEGDKERQANANAFDRLGNPSDALSDLIFGKGRKAGDAISDLWARMHAQSAPLPPNRDDYTAPNTDGNALHRWDEVPAGFKKTADALDTVVPKFGELTGKTGIVLTSFDGLDRGVVGTTGKFVDLTGGSGTLQNAFKILELTGMGAARSLAEIAMSGGGGAVGGSGFINASWGGGGHGGGGTWGGNALAVNGGFGNAGWEKSGASRPEVAEYIKSQAARLGIDPNVALRVSQSEGFNTYTGDYGTSFGPFQLHYGGSGIRGMNSGGLGDRFTRETGLNARDPTTWKAQVDYALKIAKREGWSAWHGAQHVGIGNRQGLDYHGPVPTAGPPPRGKKVTPGTPAAAPAAGTTAMNDHHRPIHVALHLDKKVIARHVVKSMVAGMTHPTSTGGPDPHATYVHSGTPLTDAA